MKHQKKQFTSNLLTWYDAHKRTLPWRENKDPYYIWVSEIMLQQTRVEAVKPYFERWITKLPTLVDLATTSEDDLRKLWEGLGYYNRVKNMKRCAQECVEKYQGHLPTTYEQLISLPGIGSYTAGAIASIAYGVNVPAVDGNVMRVFARQKRVYDDILKAKTKKSFEQLVSTYIPKDRASDFNQALMELGALICIPQARCNICPVAKQCEAYATGEVFKLPVKKTKSDRKIENKTIVCMIVNDKVKITQRTTALLHGLYEFDMLDGFYTKKQLQELYPQAKIVKLEASKHIFSHIEWHMKGYIVITQEQVAGLYVSQAELLMKYALPTALKVYKQAVVSYLSRRSIQQIKKYQPSNHQEQKDLQFLLSKIDTYDQLLTRQTDIHLSVSIWVKNKHKQQVLMVYHNIYDAYSWIGGHVDGASDLYQVAKKELEEETGITSYEIIDTIYSIEILPVKEHYKNDQKIAAHKHINITFLAYAEDQPLITNSNENSDVKWIDTNTIDEVVSEKDMRVVYRKLMNK